MEKFIVAEVTKNWTRETPVSNLISHQFEGVINRNRERGYKLIDWKINQLYTDDGYTFVETIIAIFEKQTTMPKRKQQPKHDKKPKSKLTKKSFEEDDYTEEEVDGFYAEEDNDVPLDDWSDAEDDYEDKPADKDEF